MAAEYWHAMRPKLVSPCASEQVVIDTLPDGVGGNTQIGGCTITLAPEVWADAQVHDPGLRGWVCLLVAHEYAHTLGLPDADSPAMLTFTLAHADDPVCDQFAYGWKHLSHRDREWLAAAGLAER